MKRTLLVLAFFFTALVARAADKPNFIFILIDDLGWTDAGCFGSKFYETPNIDRLAREGMKFTSNYSACTVCSPSRAAIMTGKYPARLHITDWIPGHVKKDAKLRVPDWLMHLPLEESNIGRMFHDAGYATASIGKWHLGGPDFYPDKQGFDINIGGTDKGQPPSYFSPYKIATLPDGPAGEFLSDRLTQETVKFIEEHKDMPFFVYLPHFAVHQPIAGKAAAIEKYKAKADPNAPQHNAIYASLIDSVDDSVGTILQALDDFNLAKNTVVIFCSDNGGLIGKPSNPTTSNLPLRAGKGTNYEGGVRVPLIVKWPGVTKPGSVCDTPVIGADFYPTMLEIAGLADAPKHVPDGESLVPLLKQTGALKRDAIYFHYPHYHTEGATPYGAIREGDLKLIEFYETGAHELYDLKNDIGESHDLSAEKPDVTARLARKLDDWRHKTGAQMPVQNPDWNQPAVAQSADGTILLHAHEAMVHGEMLRYEPQLHKNTLGFWTKKDDWASWKFDVKQPGVFKVEVLQGCGKGSGGAEVEVAVGEQKLAFKVEETGGFQNFVPRVIGKVKIESAGKYELTVKPQTKPGGAVMDCRHIALRPATD